MKEQIPRGFIYSGEMSEFSGCSILIQQPDAASLYRKSYTEVSNAAACWLQPVVMDVDIFPLKAQYFYCFFHGVKRLTEMVIKNNTETFLSYICMPLHPLLLH